MRLLTPAGVAGIAVVLVEEAERDAALGALGLSGAKYPPRPGDVPRRCALRLGGEVVDDVLLVHRFDGAVELHLHGAPAVLAELGRHFEVRAAVPLDAAEWLLRNAFGMEQVCLALEQMDPGFDASMSALLALPLEARRAGLRAALVRSSVASAMVRAQPLALVGRQNAGKSTLFNCLLQRERALTGALAGLTRDPIHEVTLLGGYPYELIDTAGEGVVQDALDAAAIEIGRVRRGGSIRLLVVDSSSEYGAWEQGYAPAADLVVATKSDLATGDRLGHWPRVPDATVSAERDEPGRVRHLIGELLRRHRSLPAAGALGGVAALDEEQHGRLVAALAECGDDCSSNPSPA